MTERKSQTEMIIAINSEEDLNKLSTVEMDLMLTESKYTDENQSGDTQLEQESSIPASSQNTLDKTEQQEEFNNNKLLKKASVEVHFVGVHVIPRN